jgi:hypothetical protein
MASFCADNAERVHRKDNQIGLSLYVSRAFAVSSPAYHISRMFQIGPFVRANLAELD